VSKMSKEDWDKHAMAGAAQMVYPYDPGVVLSQIPNVIRWLQTKADEAGSGTTEVSGIDCKVAHDMVARLLELATSGIGADPDEEEELFCDGCGARLSLNGQTLCGMCAEAGPLGDYN